MMRSTRLIAFVVATLASTASLAGAQVRDSAGTRAVRAGHNAGGRTGHNAPLRGVALSTAEKVKIKEIHARFRTEAKSLQESLRPAMLEARTARQKGDTAAARALLERTKGDRAKLRAMRTQEMSDVRASLSPEQQKQFDANLKQAARNRASAKKGRGTKHLQRMRPGPNG
jgi:Spy/CpxP family protein refolding chaperone